MAARETSGNSTVSRTPLPPPLPPPSVSESRYPARCPELPADASWPRCTSTPSLSRALAAVACPPPPEIAPSRSELPPPPAACPERGRIFEAGRAAWRRAAACGNTRRPTAAPARLYQARVLSSALGNSCPAGVSRGAYSDSMRAEGRGWKEPSGWRWRWMSAPTPEHCKLPRVLAVHWAARCVSVGSPPVPASFPTAPDKAAHASARPRTKGEVVLHAALKVPRASSSTDEAAVWGRFVARPSHSGPKKDACSQYGR